MQDATRGKRYLAIMVRMTSRELLLELCVILLSIARLTRRFRRGEISPITMFQFERELQDLLRELGRRIVQWTINGVEPKERSEMPGQLRWDGDYYRRHPKSPLRNLNCLFGPIKLLRYCYQPLETCGPCLFPLQIQLGIVAGVATPALADQVARGAADLTQRQLLDQLRSHRVVWGVGTVRKVTHAMAEMLSVHRQEAQVQQVLDWLKQATESKGPRRSTISVGRDGVMIPIVKQSKYKEACTATLSVLDRRGRRIGTVYLGQMPEPHQTTLDDTRPDRLRGRLCKSVSLSAAPRVKDGLPELPSSSPPHRQWSHGSRLQNRLHTTVQTLGNEMEARRRKRHSHAPGHRSQRNLDSGSRSSLRYFTYANSGNTPTTTGSIS